MGQGALPGMARGDRDKPKNNEPKPQIDNDNKMENLPIKKDKKKPTKKSFQG